jgi:formylglycine-generating enzyme required for sulfatase activity
MNTQRLLLAPAFLVFACKSADRAHAPRPDAERTTAVEAAALGAPFEEAIPTSATTLKLVPLPGPKPLWIGATEVPWEVFDVYVYKKDALRGLTNEKVDAVTRPTQPYNPMDRGFGHAGHPAISMSRLNAQGFCEWLSAHTGRTYRLPTEAEWERAARAGDTGDGPADLDSCAWTAANSPEKTQPVAKKRANALGLHDALGNAAEWCVAEDGTGVVRGGSFKTPADAVRYATRAVETPDWNLHDPQIPKSKFWLIDGGFIGFRVVCEGPAPAAKQ